MAFPLQPGRTFPMEAVSAEALPSGTGWQFEPKWDGFRCLAYRDGSRFALMGKSGKPLTPFFPEITKALGGFRSKRFVADGELVIPLGGVLLSRPCRRDCIRPKAGGQNCPSKRRQFLSCSIFSLSVRPNYSTMAWPIVEKPSNNSFPACLMLHASACRLLPGGRQRPDPGSKAPGAEFWMASSPNPSTSLIRAANARW